MNVLKILFNPIFLLAAGLHAGLLLIPVDGGSSNELVPAPNPEGESITVTRIPPTETKPSATTTLTRPAGAAVVQSRQAAAPVRRTQNTQSPSSDAATANRNPERRSQTSTNRRNSSRPSRTSRDSANELAVLSANGSNPANTPASSIPVASPSQTPPDLMALKAGAGAQDVSEKLRTFFARLHHSVRKTTEPEVEEAKMVWLATLEKQSDIQISSPEGLGNAVEISYPLIIDDNGPRQLSRCLTPMPRKALVGVVVNEDGTLATEPALLRSSGYGFLNNTAMEKIQDYTDFPEADSQKIYTVDIEVDYDQEACLDLAKLRK